MAMEIEAKKSSVEILHEAIQRLTESTNTANPQAQTSPSATATADETQILTELISQLQSLKEDGVTKAKEDESSSSSKPKEATSEEILKELKDVKRQNTRTHWLLSGMIVLTLVWQISEGLFVLKVRNGVNKPFRSLWNVVRNITQDADKQPSSSSSITDTLVESARLPGKHTDEKSQKVLELPNLQLPLPGFGSGMDL